jgi:hypothetical protein
MGGALGVNPCTAVSAYVHVPTQGGVDNATITTTTVKLYQVNADNTLVPIDARVNGTGGGDAINLSPVVGLKASTKYKFVVTDGVRSTAGYAFYPFESYFTTGSSQATPTLTNVAFDRVTIAGTAGEQYTSLAIGPDRKLYGLLLNGTLKRFPILADGNLGAPQLIGTLTAKYGTRMATGLAFDPGATAAAPVVWVSHSSNLQLDAAPAFDGKISKLSGANLENEQLVVTNLPRSRRDHLVNGIAFRPGQATALYFNQGSNSSMGAYDATWYRQEALLSGAVLKLDLTKLPATLPLDVRTTNNRAAINNASSSSYLMPVNGVNYYNPYATTSPLTLYASGVRNAFDLAWHSNGYLYVPTNGSNAGGNTPASVAGTRRPDGTFYSGPAVDSTFNVQTQQDWLFKINPGLLVNGKDYHGYFGHPNPLRGEYVANRGPADNAKYPAGTVADANYQGAAYNFATNKSPNGVIEYKSSAFNGALKGKLLVCRFGNLNDILVLEPGLNGDISKTYGDCGGAMPGLRGFVDPLDLVEDPLTGNLYVAEFGWNNAVAAQLSLCRVRLPTKINAGGNAYTTADGRNFAPDAYFTGGTPATQATGDILNTTDDYLYLTGRYSTTSFGYSLPVKPGSYNVVLHFSETFFGSNGNAGGVGSRKFNVDVEGVRKLTDYDIFARAGGAMRPVKETIPVSVSDGQLNLLFGKGSADNPKVSAIEVLPATANRAPVLAAIGGKTATEGQALTFTATATDADGTAQTLTYSLLNAPTGAAINATTGVFSWTPGETQGPGSYSFTVKVADNGSPVLSDQETITVTVSESNRAPVLAAIGSKSVGEGQTLTFTATATDPDVPAQTLTYSLLSAPAGAAINATTGAFSWTPTSAQGPATYSFTVKVADNGTPILSDQETISVTVSEGNAAPVLAFIGNKTVTEGQTLAFTATATDANGATQTLMYSLLNAPTGAAINATTGQFSWTPTSAQGPATYSFTVKVTDNGSPILSDQETITVTVSEGNAAPVLAFIGNKTATEGQVLAFTATATDAATQTLTYSLVNAPSGATINATTGAFSWTPGETQGPGSYSFTVKVTDNGSPVLSDQETISVTVSESNRAPVLAAIGSKSVVEGQALTFTATATDPDVPAQALTYSLLNAPTGAAINATTGQFTWTPTSTQGPAAYSFTVKVTDNGSPILSDQETITVTVSEGNAAPVLAYIGNKTVVEAQTLAFTATATDANGATQTLTYSLLNAPSGATINASTGQFSWTPTWAQGPASYSFTVKVTDNGSPILSDQETITVTVREPATVLRINAGGAGYTMLDSRVFRADAYYNKGEATQVSGDVLNTSDDYLYRTAREGLDSKRRRNNRNTFTYDLPTGNGTFDVTLYFAEIYWGKLVAGGAGSRKFHVNIEGVRKLTDYDIFARTGGAMRPVRETFRVRVADGVLTLNFLDGARDVPIVSAIEVVSAPVTTARVAAAEGGSADDEPFRAQAMPVPVRDRLSVVVNIPASRVKPTALTDAAGRTYRLPAPRVVAENRLILDVSGLKAGMYLLHLESDKGRRVLKFVKE